MLEGNRRDKHEMNDIWNSAFQECSETKDCGDEQRQDDDSGIEDEDLILEILDI